jgi:hypothetical protein
MAILTRAKKIQALKIRERRKNRRVKLKKLKLK